MKKLASIVISALVLSASMASAQFVLDGYDTNPGSPTHGGFRSVTWTEPDLMTNNPNDTRGGQGFGFFNGNLLDLSSAGFSDASGSGVVMTIDLTEEIGNELPGIGKVMLADSLDRRWIFEFDDFSTGSSLGNPATSATALSFTSNATSGRALGEGTNDGNDFDWSAVGKASGQAYWIQVFPKQTGGGAHPINLTFDQMSIVPEPSTAALVLGAFGGLLALRRRLR